MNIAIGMLAAYAGIGLFIWLFLHKLPSIKIKKKISRLRVGSAYVLDKADPFTSIRVVIEQISSGYVAYRYIQRDEKLSSIQSCKAETFVRVYEEFAKP